MSKQDKKLYIQIVITIIFLITVVFFIYAQEKKYVENIITTPSPLLRKEGAQTTLPQPKTKNPPLPASPAGGLSEGGARGGNSVTLLAGDATAHISFPPNTLFYNALVQEKNAGRIEFSGKNYPGLGFFVTDIGSLHAGNGKSLLYYINGKEATVGVSSYTLKDGDIIEWKLE